MKRMLWGAALALGAMSLSGVSRADTFTWNFDVPTGNVGSTTHTYADTSNLFSITAHAYAGGRNLFGKFTSGDPSETGLGINDRTSNEIQVGDYIQLDVENLQLNGFTDMTMYIGSVQGDSSSGEGFKIWGSNTLGTLGTELTHVRGGDVDSYIIGDITNYRYFSVQGTDTGDVLIRNGLKANRSPIPEPAFYQMSALLLLGGAGVMRMRRRTK